jgi:hypothetical protein
MTTGEYSSARGRTPAAHRCHPSGIGLPAGHAPVRWNRARRDPAAIIRPRASRPAAHRAGQPRQERGRPAHGEPRLPALVGRCEQARAQPAHQRPQRRQRTRDGNRRGSRAEPAAAGQRRAAHHLGAAAGQGRHHVPAPRHHHPYGHLPRRHRDGLVRVHADPALPRHRAGRPAARDRHPDGEADSRSRRRRTPRPGRSGCRRCPRSGSRSGDGRQPRASYGPDPARQPCPGTPRRSRPSRPRPPGRRRMRLSGASVSPFRHHAERRSRSGGTRAEPPICIGGTWGLAGGLAGILAIR